MEKKSNMANMVSICSNIRKQELLDSHRIDSGNIGRERLKLVVRLVLKCFIFKTQF